MAQIKHLPIYKTAYELLETTVKVTKEFPRDFKFSIVTLEFLGKPRLGRSAKKLQSF
jgi:hypothetical protein